MVSLASLWLPIVLSAAVVFVLSFVAWTLLPHHKKDYVGMKNEDAVLDVVRNQAIEPGQYMFPHCPNPKDPEHVARWKRGPNGVLYVWGSPGSMGRNLVLTFIFYLVVGVFVAYLTSEARGRGEDFMNVFQVAGAAAVMAYVLGGIPHGIWFQRTLRSMMTDVADALVYGVVTGLIFAWLWPAGVEMI